MTTAKKPTAAPRKKRYPATDRGRMEQLRDRLQAIVKDPKTTPRDVVAASREYRIVVAEMAKTTASAPKAGGGSTLDEIAARRRKRGA